MDNFAFNTFNLVIAAVLFLLLMSVLIPISIRFGLVDHPDARKHHIAPTPLIGGIAICVAFFIASVVTSGGELNWSVFAWFGIVLAIGVIDDLTDLSQRLRLAVHAAVVVGIGVTDGYLVYELGNIFGPFVDVSFAHPIAIAFTVLAVVGAINSVNMIDGLDGLLSSLLLVSLMGIFITGNGSESALLTEPVFFTLVGSIVGFTLVNSRFLGRNKALVFMGDAGSTTIGFILVYLLIASSQSAAPTIAPVSAGWLLGLPLLDASSVIATRLLSGKSIIEPGRDHLHHILLRYFENVNKVVFTMAAIQIAMVAIGIFGPRLFGDSSDVLLFWLFVFLIPVRCLLTLKLESSLWNTKKNHMKQPN